MKTFFIKKNLSETVEIVDYSHGHHVLYAHFPTTMETIHTEFYIYDWVAIISEVGGALGLFLGFSCLSVALGGVDRVVERVNK